MPWSPVLGPECGSVVECLPSSPKALGPFTSLQENRREEGEERENSKVTGPLPFCVPHTWVFKCKKNRLVVEFLSLSPSDCCDKHHGQSNLERKQFIDFCVPLSVLPGRRSGQKF